MKIKTKKMPVTRCCECGRITNIKTLIVRPFSVEMGNKKNTRVICWDCEVKELVCYG